MMVKNEDRMMGRVLASLLCATVLLSGCAGSNRNKPLGMFEPQEPIVDLDGAFAANGPYRLASGDRLRIIVYGQDSLSNSYTVDAAGFISMPLIGQVPAQGRTTVDIQREVTARLSNGYIRMPNVSAEVDLYRPFFVMGEVTTSGQFPYVAGMNVQNAIAIAGGFSPRANRERIEITRKIGGTPMKAFVPPSYTVRPGDIISVKERWF